MYAKSLIVVALCTIFVLAFALVLNYEAANVGTQESTVVTSQTSCAASSASCDTLAITSASLHTVNYTDELGTVNYANLTIGLEPSGPYAVTSVDLFVGNVSAGSLRGPFNPGSDQVRTLTLPSTVSVSAGKTYTLSVEGFYGSGSTAWESTRVTAQ